MKTLLISKDNLIGANLVTFKEPILSISLVSLEIKFTFSLSLDNIIIGIGMYTFSHYLAFIIISNLLISYFLFYIANKYFINRKKNKNIDYSWLGGIIFLLIGIYRLI